MEEKFRKYAELLLKKGLGINEGQPLVVNAPVEAIGFVRVLVDVASGLGVSDIYFDWDDDKIKHTLLKSNEFDEIKDSRFWNKSVHDEYAKRDAAFLFLTACSGDIMKDIDADKLKRVSGMSLNTRALYREMQSNNKVDWCIAAVSTKDWGEYLFPDCEDACSKLWEKIFDICLVNEDSPIDEWNKKLEINHEMCEKLNSYRIKEMHYKSSNGTDLVVELCDKARWLGGSSIIKGREIIVNMPTEEVFTTPNKYKTNGVVYASMPLVHSGIVIKDIKLEFKDGKVVSIDASSGLEELKNILSTDEEASMLGEVALVDINSKIAESNILFYETLYDENAACHIAVGRGFKECLDGMMEVDEKELDKYGYNNSKNHVDIMIGTNDLEITAKTYDWEEVVIFKNGSFNF